VTPETPQLARLVDVPIPEDIKVGHGWPESLVELADHIGAAAALKLCQAWGGLDYYIPSKLPLDHDLRRILGDEPAEALSAAYGNNRIVLPRARKIFEKLRRGHILAEVRAGRLGKRQAARRLETSYRQILTWLKDGEGTDKAGRTSFRPVNKYQLDMFRRDA
jgi:hypothetical protein